MSDSEAQAKPKRTLTEAQRLAFLKGREKRMSNLEKKRLEKIEEKMSSAAMEFKAPPKKPRVSRKKVEVEPPAESKPEPEPKEEVKVEVGPPPPKPVLQRESPIPSFLDEDRIASRVAEEVLRKIQESKPKRKPRAVPVPRVPREETVPTPPVEQAAPAVVEPEPEPEPPVAPRVVHNFSWL